MPSPAADWFPDPLGTGHLRWWTGSSWTSWVFDGESVHAMPVVPRRRLTHADLAHLRFIEGVFLPELAATGGLTPEQALRAAELIQEMASEIREPSHGVPAAGAAREAPGQVAPPRTWVSPGVSVREPSGTDGAAGSAPASAHPAAITTTPTALRAPLEPVAREPGPLARWWQRSWQSVRSDLALHGVAYLGVLLFFVGAFGLVAFAFGDVEPRMRPVAEVVIALVPFAAAALLLRRGAMVVGRALEVAGGLLLPVMVVTSFLDGVGFPPNLTGTQLVIALTLSCGVVTGAYAAWALRHRESALRYVVAPAAWLTAAMASLGLGRPIPSGEGVAVPGSAQVAVTLAVLVGTVAWARRAPRAHLSAPSCAAAVPGTFILGLLAVLTWIRESDPRPASILAAGILGIASLEMLSGDEPPGNRVAGSWSAVIEPAWWAAAVTSVAASTGVVWGFAVGALGFLALVELAGRRRRPAWALAIPAVGAVALGAQTVQEPWLLVGVLAASSAWALLRRRSPFCVPGAGTVLDLAALTLPLCALAAYAHASQAPVAILLGAGLLLPATAAARRGTDAFWAKAWGVWLVALGIGGAAAWAAATTGQQPEGDPWFLVLAAALLTCCVALGPLSTTGRIWLVATLGSFTWLLTCWAGALPLAARGTALGAAGVALIGTAHGRRLRDTRNADDVGLSGHALSAAAVGLAGVEWGLVACLGLFTVGWAITAFADAGNHSPVGRRLASLGTTGRFLPPALVSAGVVATTLVGLWVGDPQTWGTAAPVALSAIAMAMALVTRAALPRHARSTFGWAGFVLPMGAVAIAESPWAQVLGLGALMAAVGVLPAGVRRPAMTWVAWAAPAPMAWLVATQAWPAFADQPVATQAALALVGVGSVLLLGAASADLLAGPWIPRWRPRRPTLLPPVALGAAEGAAGLTLVALSPPAPVTGWTLVAAAVVLLIVALLARAGSLAGGAVLCAWAGTLVLRAPDHTIPPLTAVASVTALLGMAELAHRISPDREWWSRWDAALALAAFPIAIVAVGTAWGTPAVVPTNTLLGLLTVASAARLRTIRGVALPLAVLGTGLILTGAEAAGPWWFAAAVTALAFVLTAAAVRASGTGRTILQWAGAVTSAAAWGSIVVAAGWPLPTATGVTLWIAGFASLTLATLLWAGRISSPWVQIWGGLCAVAVVAIATACWAGAAGLQVTPAVVGALGLLTAALLLGAPSLGLAGLRDVASLTGLAALATLLRTVDATPTAWVLAMAAVSAAAAVCTLLLGPVPRRMSIEVGAGAAGIALALAAEPSAGRGLLVAALVACAIQAAAIGSALASLVIQALAPLFACAAWLVFVVEASAGGVELWTAPIGLTLLVIVGLWRHDRSRRSRPVASTEIVTVEAVGVVLLVGASLVLMVTDSLMHVIPAVALGIGVAAWGTVTQVRRRVLMGATAVVAALVLLVAVPLVSLMPEWQGAGLWFLLLGLGIAALLVAALLERGRAATRAALGHFNEMTADWE